MDPKTRTTLMIGGAVIVIALLVTCGPMRNFFGGEGAGTEGVSQTPVVPTAPVGAGPPANAEAELDVAVADADEGDAAVEDEAAEQPALGASRSGVAVTPVVVSASAPGKASGAEVSAASAGTSSAVAGGIAKAEPVASAPVSAAPLRSPVENTAVASPLAAIGLVEATADAFDDAFGDLEGGDAAGPAVDRFAPPVAAPSGGQLALNQVVQTVGIGVGGIRRPCDAPGSGCRNVTAGSGPPVTLPNPPIIPGGGRQPRP